MCSHKLKLCSHKLKICHHELKIVEFESNQDSKYDDVLAFGLFNNFYLAF